MSPSVAAGNSLRPDLLLEVDNKCLCILELTIGYETNLTSNIARKDRKYQDLTRTLQHYNKVKLIKLSISTLGVPSSYSTSCITMIKELSIEERYLTSIQRKISTMTVRSTCCYYRDLVQHEKVGQFLHTESSFRSTLIRM